MWKRGGDMKKEFDYVVYIGRFEPAHKAHIETLRKALAKASFVIVLVGSANQPRTTRNPFTWQEREEMIRACFEPSDQKRMMFIGISDTYNDQEWARSVQDAITTVEKTNAEFPPLEGTNVGLIGHKKDDSSYYLDMFPQWKFIGVENIDDLHSTEIRRQMFESEQIDKAHIPEGIYNYLNAFMNSQSFSLLKEEYEFTQKYKEAWATSPYPPTFVTVDAVVVQSGHVLLVRRRSAPGKGLWALPGGFLDQTETIEHAAVRELREETKLKVPEPVLFGNIQKVKVFDKPSRSLRGRTITHAHYIELPPGQLPKVKGSDDADKAKWVPLGVFEKMQDQMFEDHFHIVRYFTGT